MMKFKINGNYRFKADGRETFLNLRSTINSAVVKAMENELVDTFRVCAMSETGSVSRIRMGNGREIRPSDIGALDGIDCLISFDEAHCFEEIKLVAVDQPDEAKYDVMTCTKGVCEGFFIRHTEVTYDEAVEWASNYVKKDEDEQCYIIQRFAKVELQMEPTVKIEKM